MMRSELIAVMLCALIFVGPKNLPEAGEDPSTALGMTMEPGGRTTPHQSPEATDPGGRPHRVAPTEEPGDGEPWERAAEGVGPYDTGERAAERPGGRTTPHQSASPQGEAFENGADAGERNAEDSVPYDAGDGTRAAGGVGPYGAEAMDAEELRLLCNLIYFEARGCGDRHQQLVAAVALNRVADPRFPDTLFGVLTQPGQYGDGSYAWQSPEITPEIRANAEAALAGTVECPADVVFQAEFIQGSGIYEISAVDTGWWRSTTYFCRG